MGNLVVRGTGLSVLQDQLLIQCGTDDVATISSVLRRGAGLVLTGKSVAPGQNAPLTFPGPLLRDRARYAGPSRLPALVGVSPDWIADQRHAGTTAALTDSGYIASGDESGLATILSQTERLGQDVIATLPLHQHWLSADVGLLIDAVSSHGVPVAVVVEHSKDPFGSLRALRGLVQLIRSVGVPVILLRSDISALGAMAFGALSCAIGTRSRLRHLYPVPHGPRWGSARG